jgi:hypothetical protein
MRSPESGNGDLIACYSIETLIKNARVDVIDLMKIDIEGAEVDVFANCSSWIDKVRHIIIETHSPYSYEKFFDDLNRANWQFDVVDQNIEMACVRRKSA